MSNDTHTELKQCMSKEDVFKDAMVIIAGPTNNDKVDEFKLSVKVTGSVVLFLQYIIATME